MFVFEFIGLNFEKQTKSRSKALDFLFQKVHLFANIKFLVRNSFFFVGVICNGQSAFSGCALSQRFRPNKLKYIFLSTRGSLWHRVSHFGFASANQNHTKPHHRPYRGPLETTFGMCLPGRRGWSWAWPAAVHTWDCETAGIEDVGLPHCDPAPRI